MWASKNSERMEKSKWPNYSHIIFIRFNSIILTSIYFQITNSVSLSSFQRSKCNFKRQKYKTQPYIFIKVEEFKLIKLEIKEIKVILPITNIYRKINLLLFPTLQLQSLPVTRRASRSSFPVDNPLAEKKERRDFQVTEQAIRSIPLLMKWPFSFRVAGSIPKLRAMNPRSIFCSSEATISTDFESEGHRSFIPLVFFSSISAFLSFWSCDEIKLRRVLDCGSNLRICEFGWLRFYGFWFDDQCHCGFWLCQFYVEVCF